MVTLREARERKGWSQTQLGKELGLSASTIQRIETGKGTSSYATVYKLCDALGTSDLMDAIPFRTNWYLITCRGKDCGITVTRRASVVRRRQARKGSSYVMDPKKGTGTFLCPKCFGNPVMKERWANRVRSDGVKKANAHMARLRARRDPKWSDIEYLREHIKVVQEARRGTHTTTEVKRRIAAAHRQTLPISRPPNLCPISNSSRTLLALVVV